MSDDTSIDTVALDAFIEISVHQAGELDTRVAELIELRRRVVSLSGDHAVATTVLNQVQALASRWRSTHVFVRQVLDGSVGADQPGSAGLTPWSSAGQPVDTTPWTLDDEPPDDTETYPHDPQPGIHRQITVPILDPDTGLETYPVAHQPREILGTPPDPDAGIPRPVTPPALSPDGQPLHDPRTGQPLYNIRLLGDGGTRMISKTPVPEIPGRPWHLDIENPAPGVRPGQLHLQYKDKGKQAKYYYDFEHDTFLPDQDGRLLPSKIEKDVRQDPKFRIAIDRAREWLNVPESDG